MNMKKLNRTDYWRKCVRELKIIFENKNITRCEKCGTDNFLGFAHKSKRREYYSCPEKLKDFNEVLLLCTECHAKIEGKKQLTEELFNKLRGEE